LTRSDNQQSGTEKKCLRTSGPKAIMTSLPTAASNSDRRRCSHPDCRATDHAAFPVCQTALPGFSGTTNLSATPRRPACPSRASGWSSPTTPWGFPCFVRFPCVHAAATTPAQRLGVLLRSLHPAVSAFPERVIGSACALSFSRLARRSLALRPAHSRGHQFVTRIPKASAISLPP
jgi:hypothetical protein